MATRKPTSKRRPSRSLGKKATPRSAAKKSAVKKVPQKRSILKVIKLVSHDVTVDYLPEAKKFSEARKRTRIHPRKIIPDVRKGARIRDLTPTAAMNLDDQILTRAVARGAAPRAITDTIKLVKNKQLDDVALKDTSSHVCEPSVAINGDVIFYTGNWFAAVSLDGGNSFKYIDPFSTFPDPPGLKFQCDQIVHYIESINRFVWLLQYSEHEETGDNILRVAYATTEMVKVGKWKYFDLTPKSLKCAAGTWLDFPDLSTGKNMLYVTTNNFEAENWKSSIVVRIKFKSFTSGVLSASSFRNTRYSSMRVAQNCGTTAYFAAHKSTSALRVFKWQETSAKPTFKDVKVASWADESYSSMISDGSDWLELADNRPTGATMVNKEFWCAWGSGSGGVNERPHSFVQIARINTSNMKLLENINLWDPDSAIFYAALSTNKNDEVGASFMIGGPSKFPSHLVGILTGTQRQVITFTGKRGPAGNRWGDYLTVRRNYPNQKLFIATGYVLKPGSGDQDATPHFTVFGRLADV